MQCSAKRKRITVAREPNRLRLAADVSLSAPASRQGTAIFAAFCQNLSLKFYRLVRIFVFCDLPCLWFSVRHVLLLPWMFPSSFRTISFTLHASGFCVFAHLIQACMSTKINFDGDGSKRTSCIRTLHETLLPCVSPQFPQAFDRRSERNQAIRLNWLRQVQTGFANSTFWAYPAHTLNFY